MTCECSTCTLGMSVNRIINIGTREEMASLAESLHSDLQHAQEDIGYFRALMDGSWPSAVERLSAALSVAVEKRRNAAR